VIIFGSVFIKKNNQTELKKKPKSVQTGQFRFGSIFLGQKPVQTDFFSFGSVWIGFFSGLARFFPGFFRFGFGSIRVFRF
jgi:hypothetical protein